MLAIEAPDGAGNSGTVDLHHMESMLIASTGRLMHMHGWCPSTDLCGPVRTCAHQCDQHSHQHYQLCSAQGTVTAQQPVTDTPPCSPVGVPGRGERLAVYCEAHEQPLPQVVDATTVDDGAAH